MERMRTVKNMGVNEAMSDGKRQDKADSRERKKKVHPDCLLVPAANKQTLFSLQHKKNEASLERCLLAGLWPAAFVGPSRTQSRHCCTV